MFGGYPVAAQFSMGHTRASYVMRHGFGPVVQKELVKETNTSENWYTLFLGETITKQLAKQINFFIRHWSNSEYQVVTRYLDSKVFNHVKAEDLCNKIIDAMQESGLDLKLLFNISSDDPNINKSLSSKLNEQMRILGYNRLILLVTYVLHTGHNRFHYGIVTCWNEVKTLP